MGVFTTTLAGAKHRQTEILKVIRWMTEGPVSIHLEAEPANPHDPNAVRVDAEKEGEPKTRTQIGYLPAQVAERVHHSLDYLRVSGVQIRTPDEEWDFCNLVFTFTDIRGLIENEYEDDGDDLDEDVRDDINRPMVAPRQRDRTLKKSKGLFLAVVLFSCFVVLSWLFSERPASDLPHSVTPDEIRENAKNLDDGKVWVTLLKTSNIRRGPGTDQPVVRVINRGERYRCYESEPEAEWVKCYEGQYLYRQLVKFDSPIN